MTKMKKWLYENESFSSSCSSDSGAVENDLGFFFLPPRLVFFGTGLLLPGLP